MSDTGTRSAEGIQALDARLPRKRCSAAVLVVDPDGRIVLPVLGSDDDIDHLVVESAGILGWRAGWVQMGIDGTILIASLAMIEPKRIAMSILGALALNLTLALNHRPGRYVAF